MGKALSRLGLVLPAGPVTRPAWRHHGSYLILEVPGASSLGAAQRHGGQLSPPGWWRPLAASPPRGGLCRLLLGWLLVGENHPNAAKGFPKLY